MRRFRWWLSDILRQWADAVEPAVEPIDIQAAVVAYLRSEGFADSVVKNNALLSRLKNEAESPNA